ncbi:hypothetical protein VNI00_006755 [Paramarasmius palmivorus]|uniref:Uncharacterized protein n=1 Tax=Paramarasmius palmivorus TaxID=297713 RepID=A0AAW0D456_9AGAR
MARKLPDSDGYAPLLQDETDIELKPAKSVQQSRNSGCRIKNAIIVVQSIVILVLILVTMSSYSWRKSGPLLYSPVNHLLEERVVKFHSAIGNDTTIYMGEPSPEVDEAWDELYGFGVNKISKHEADQLPLKTVRIPNDPSHYIVELDVFHQLHCLNIIRKALHRDYYQQLHVHNGHTMESKQDEDEHIAHCIDHLRQSIMCASDVSTIVWQWIPERNRTMGRSGVPHTCRDFEKISEWAGRPENQIRFADFDFDVKPPEDD